MRVFLFRFHFILGRCLPVPLRRLSHCITEIEIKNFASVLNQCVWWDFIYFSRCPGRRPSLSLSVSINFNPFSKWMSTSTVMFANYFSFHSISISVATINRKTIFNGHINSCLLEAPMHVPIFNVHVHGIKQIWFTTLLITAIANAKILNNSYQSIDFFPQSAPPSGCENECKFHGKCDGCSWFRGILLFSVNDAYISMA